jgi:hypothetical protein
MQKYLTILGFLFFATGIYAQKETAVIRVKQGYAVINKGAQQGVKAGDRFTLHTANNPNEYGEVEVIKASESIAAVKLVKGTPGYTLKVGDREHRTESAIVDELLQETQSEQYVEPYRQRHYSKPPIQRKGFILGLGIGFGGMSLNANSFLGSGEVTRSAFITDFRIGYAPSNTFEIYYVSKVFWWGESGWTLIHGLSSIGFSTYLNKETETGLFLTTGVGVSTVDAPFENVNPSYGLGLFGGLGYEFVRHWTFEVDLLYSYISDVGVDLRLFGLGLTISGLIY